MPIIPVLGRQRQENQVRGQPGLHRRPYLKEIVKKLLGRGIKKIACLFPQSLMSK
jgi:hypothetical protein